MLKAEAFRTTHAERSAYMKGGLKMQGNSGLRVGILVLFVFGQSCAANLSLDRNALQSLPHVTVVRSETPPLREATPGAAVVGLLVAGYAGALAATQMNSADSPTDFNAQLQAKLVEKITSDIPTFPPLTVEQTPLPEAPSDKPSLTIETSNFALALMGWVNGGGYGVSVQTVASLQDGTGKVLWRKELSYLSGHHRRSRPTMTEFKDNDAKLLKEEIDYAAEVFATECVKDLKSSIAGL